MALLTHPIVEAEHALESARYLEDGLALAESLAARASSRAQALALDSFGDLAVPPPAALPDDQAHIRALASLYLTAQLEHASLLPSVELLAGIGVSGGLLQQLGPVASKLLDFWRHRNERYAAAERRSLFERLFDSDFDSLMIGLCEALYKLDEGTAVPGSSNPLQRARVRAMAQQLSEHLLERTSGDIAFAADDILAATRTATEILKDPRLQHAFGVKTIWKAVGEILRRYGSEQPESAVFVMRGKAGLTILSWLADAQALLPTSTQLLVGLDHPVIGAAVDWLETSLSIEQGRSDAAATPAEGA